MNTLKQNEDVPQANAGVFRLGLGGGDRLVGMIERMYVSKGHNYFGHHEQPAGEYLSEERDEIVCVAGRGIEGDRFFDFKADYKGQITFFSMEVFEELCATLQVTARSPGATRRNVFTRGVELSVLYGREFSVQGVRFLGVGECHPCYWMDTAISPGAESALQGLGGLRAKILTTGTIKIGPI